MDPSPRSGTFRIDCHPAVRCLAYAPDGFSLAAGGLDSRVVIYYLPSATVRTTIKRQGAVWAVAYSTDGNCLAIGGADQRIAFHDVGTRTRRHDVGTGVARARTRSVVWPSRRRIWRPATRRDACIASRRDRVYGSEGRRSTLKVGGRRGVGRRR